ncbi:MAG TPA: hypothetical protein QGG37_11510, partial [Chloroflexota bacterium]|nr:hypothetical protein [Chloroflexota bacterium]
DSPIPECPRGMVQRLLTQLADRGFTMRAGFEIEFNAFEESITEARGHGYRDLTPLGGNVRSIYSTTKSLSVVRFMDALTRRLDQLGLHWESWMDEGGTGQQVGLGVLLSCNKHKCGLSGSEPVNIVIAYQTVNESSI